MYFYKIMARDKRGQESPFSEVISGIPKDTVAPDPPTGLTAVMISHDSLILSWNASGDDVVGYNIYRGTTLHPTQDWGELIGTVTWVELFTDSNLTELTTYYYLITALDEVGLESDFSKDVLAVTTGLGRHGPEINNSLDNFSIPEDSIDDTSINLYHWFKDKNKDRLDFKVTGQTNINVTIYNNNGTVILRPASNWNGQEILIFTASDRFNNISAEVTITVTPVNDPPGTVSIISPKSGIIINETETIDFEAVCDDPDLIYGDELSFKWYLNEETTPFNEGSTIRDIKLPPGEHTLLLEVTDSDGKVSKASIDVTVLKVKEKSEAFLSGIAIAGISAVIVILVVIIIFLIVLRKKKEGEDKKEEDEGTPFVEATMIPPTEAGEAGVQPPLEFQQVPQAQEPAAIPPGPAAQPPESTEAGAVLSEPQVYPGLPPGAEQEVTQMIDYTQYIDWGRAYSIITKESDFAQMIFENYLERSFGFGLSITRVHPSKLATSMILDGTKKIWLSKTPDENSISPTNLTKIAHEITEFLKLKEKCVILLDGLEYLISNNEFPKVMKFIETMHEKIVLNNAVLLVPFNPSALPKNNVELLEKELSNVIRDPQYAELH
jgi:hypothetical protein